MPATYDAIMNSRTGWCGAVAVTAVCALGGLGAVSCGKPAPVVPGAAPAARVDGGIQIPQDAFAVIDVDLERVRKSAVWHLVRRVVTHESSVVMACPGVLDTAQQATVAMRAGERRSGFEVSAILHGIDRAATLACLRARPAPSVAAPNPPAGTGRSLACQRYDDAIHGLAECGTVALTSIAELRHAQDALAAATRDGAEAACATATAAIEHATARRSEMGWECGSDDFGDEARREARASREGARRTGELHPIGPDSFLLEDRELLQFVDDHTLVTVRAGRPVYGDATALQAALRALLASPSAPRWYDAARTARDRTRAIWLALDPEQLDARDRDRHDDDDPSRVPLPRLAGTIDVGSDLGLDLRVQRGHYGEELSTDLFNLVSRIDRDPLLAHATAKLTCLGSAPAGPRVQRCAAAIARREQLIGRQIVLSSSRAWLPPDRLLVGEVYDASEISSCVDQPWPDGYLDCLTAAADSAAGQHCNEQWFGDKLENVHGHRAICGARDVGLRIALPLPLIESFKLAELALATPRLDCREPSSGAPRPVVVLRNERTSSVEAGACFGDRGGCLIADLAVAHTGHADTRWRHDSLYPEEDCLGPWNATPSTDLNGHNLAPPGTLPDLSWLSLHCGGEVYATTESRTQTARLCTGEQGKDCVSFRAAGPIHTLSVNPRGSLIALVSGAPGAQWVETFARATKRRIARFSAGTTAAQPCARAQLLGDTILVTTGACTADARSAPGAYLATSAGKRLALVGGDQPLALSSTPPLALGGHRWAFVAATGDAVVIHDASTGAVERRIATGAPVEPDMVTAGADTLGHLVLAFGGATPRSGSLASIDVATGAVLPIAPLPICPADVRLWPARE